MKNPLDLKNPRNGPAPVQAHEIYTALAVEPSGVKPRPKSPGSSEMVGIPVRAHLADVDDDPVELNVLHWWLKPHVAAGYDKAKERPTPEVEGYLRFAVSLPPGYRLVKDEPPEDEPIPTVVGVDMASGPDKSVSGVFNTLAGPIAEFAGVDPAVFATDPERHAAAMRRLHGKPEPGQSPGP